MTAAPDPARPLDGRTALVVGGARGIGGAITAALARDGARVAVVYHEGGEAALTLKIEVEAAGGSLVALQADARDQAAFRAGVRKIVDVVGPVDVLVHSAGISGGMPVLGADLGRMREVFEVNFWAAVVATQAVLPAMLSRRFGRIVFISSVVGDRGGSQGQAAYAASKAALNALARTLAAEVSSRGDLTVNAVAPGPVRTRLTAAAFEVAGEAILAQTPAGRFGKPAEIGDVVAFLVSERAAYVTGQVLYVDGGFGNKYIGLRRPREERS